jgi:hypothetical protein
VHYLPADGSAPPHTNGVATDHGDDTTMISPQPPAYTPQAQHDDASSHADSRTQADAYETSAEAAPDSERTLQEQLAAANAKLAKLEREKDESGLRRRKEDSSETKGLAQGGVSMGVPTVQASQGVPVQTVAILCLVVFLLTYLLF